MHIRNLPNDILTEHFASRSNVSADGIGFLDFAGVDGVVMGAAAALRRMGVVLMGELLTLYNVGRKTRPPEKGRQNKNPIYQALHQCKVSDLSRP